MYEFYPVSNIMRNISKKDRQQCTKELDNAEYNFLHHSFHIRQTFDAFECFQNVFQTHFPINRISGSELDGGEGRMIQQRLEDCSLHSSRRRRGGGDVIVHRYLPSIMKSAAAYAEEEEEGTKDVHSYHHSTMLSIRIYSLSSRQVILTQQNGERGSLGLKVGLLEKIPKALF